MKLSGDFFRIIGTELIPNGLISRIELNPKHIVYAAHFPGHPVTPGVIQLQIVHELLEMQLQKTLGLHTMPNCKFLKILNPEVTFQIDIRIEIINAEEKVKIKASGEKDGAVYFKLDAEYYYK